MNEQDFEAFKQMMFNYTVAALNQQLQEYPGQIDAPVINAFIERWIGENYPFNFKIGCD